MKNKADANQKAIERALEKYLPLPDQKVLHASVIDAMRYSLLCGGKRIRPMLTLAFCELCGGDPEQALPFACAVEMVHTYSLIHDDMPCMDNDDMRRGKPANHKVYGEDMALLAGDGLLTKAFETVLSAEIDPLRVIQGAQILAECAGAEGMVGGQCIDLRTGDGDHSLQTLQMMDMGKTVALISAACRMGCTAAGAVQEQLQAAEKYASGIGMAFQIRDDVLDVLGDAGKLGKNTGADCKQEKVNYVTLLGPQRAQILVESYTAEALEALQNFSGDTAFLKELARTLAGRET